MYGKIFDSIYDGTLRADWKALITFQQLIILAGPDGVVDMTAHAIHGRTGIPLDIIEHGLKVLAEPDPHSRSSEHEGRRIVLLDEHRQWGWKLVNHAYYRDLISRADKREKDRLRIADKRKQEKSGVSQDVAGCRSTSPEVADVAHASCKLQATDASNTSASNVKITFSADLGFQGVDGYMETWKKAYPAINVNVELEKAKAWLLANPKNKKSNYARFLTNWFSRSQDRAPRIAPTHISPSVAPPKKPDTGPSPTPEQMQKNRERIGELVRTTLKKTTGEAA